MKCAFSSAFHHEELAPFSGDRVELEGVSAAVWARSAIDDRLRKEAGRHDAQLNGQRVELVLRHGW